MAMRAHLRRTKSGTRGARTVAHVLAITNQCPFCNSTFNAKTIEQYHVARTMATGACNVDGSVFNVEASVPSSLECPVCEVNAQDLASLQRHIVSHRPRLAKSSSLRMSVACQELPDLAPDMDVDSRRERDLSTNSATTPVRARKKLHLEDNSSAKGTRPSSEASTQQATHSKDNLLSDDEEEGGSVLGPILLEQVLANTQAIRELQGVLLAVMLMMHLHPVGSR
jgi:hypothetical protein